MTFQASQLEKMAEWCAGCDELADEGENARRIFFGEGDLVSYEFKQSGRYRNISRIAKIKAPDHPAEGYGSGDARYLPTDKDFYIIRQSCLRSASNLLANLDVDWEEKALYTLDVARQFEKYVLGRTRPETESPQPDGKKGRRLWREVTHENENPALVTTFGDAVLAICIFRTPGKRYI